MFASYRDRRPRKSARLSSLLPSSALLLGVPVLVAGIETLLKLSMGNEQAPTADASPPRALDGTGEAQRLPGVP